MTGERLLDWQTFLERVDGDQELATELVGIFLERSPLLVQQLNAAVAAQDAPGLNHAAHSLKGAVAVFGAERVVVLAQKLEDLGAAGRANATPADVTELGRLATQLEDELRAQCPR